MKQEKLNLENTVNVAYNDLVGAIKFYEASNKTVKSLKVHLKMHLIDFY